MVNGDKEEACTRLAQLPCKLTSKRDTDKMLIADRHVRIVTSKMSCTQVKEKERDVRDLPRSKHEGRGDGS